MDDRSSVSTDRQAQALVAKLREIHRDLGTSPGPLRLEALRVSLEEILNEVDGPGAPALVSAAREIVSEEAPPQDEATVKAVDGAPAEPAEPDPPAPAPPSDPGVLEAMKDGLRRCTQGENVTAEELNLPESEARLYRLVKELLRFALDYEVGLNALLFQFSIGVSSKFDTQIRKGFQRIVRDRFRACLENQEGSLTALKESLQRNHKFLIDLNLAYDNCLRHGVNSLLEEMEPAPVVQKHKRWLGHDWAGAVQSLTQMHGDFSNLTREELWERYFFPPFRDRLAGYLELEEEVD